MEQGTHLDLEKALPAINRLKDKIIVVKYGGNAMIDDELKHSVATDIAALRSLGMQPVIVHGGGPAIKKLLAKVGKETEFVAGLRITDAETMGYVEMALSGQVNSEIVKLINSRGARAVGFSGKDGNMVIATKQLQHIKKEGKVEKVDIGQVGNIKKVDPSLILSMLDNNYIPVIAPIGIGTDLVDYNINADVFAGHIAAALKAEQFFLLTDVDGLLEDINEPNTLVKNLTVSEAQSQIGDIIQGGMIPKTDSCIYALQNGVNTASILNGTRKHVILHTLFGDFDHCTKITQS